MTKLIKIFFLFSFLTSCSYLIESYDKDILEEKEISPLDQTQKTTCRIIQKNMLLNENESSQKIFNDLIKKITNQHLISFIDRTVLWSFIQMNIRPDLSSPTAKLQVLIFLNGKETYYNSFTKNGSGLPYMYLLEYLLKKHKSRYKLKRLAQIYDKYLSGPFKVSSDFEQFLESYKSSLSKNPILKTAFMRGDETLKEGEGIPILKVSPLVVSYLKSKRRIKYKVNNHLFKYQNNTSFVPSCNFDMNLYKESIFLINKENVKGHVFGLKNKSNAFMAVSSQYIENLKSLNKTTAFQGYSNTRSASLCSFKNRLKKFNKTWLVSSESRDPGQHLYHLLEYGLEGVNKLGTLDDMLKFSRHLFLKNPVRLVIESRRSDKQQISELLKLDIPIYNAKKLGKVWGFFRNKNQSSFILDARRQGHIECNSN